MTRYRLEVRVTPRPALLDPEGQAIHRALRNLDYTEVEDVRAGKLFHLDLQAAGPQEARERGEDMARKLLANPVTEDFEVRVSESADDANTGETEGRTAPEATGGAP